MALMALAAPAARNVTSATGTPPSISAFASGTASRSRLLSLITGTTPMDWTFSRFHSLRSSSVFHIVEYCFTNSLADLIILLYRQIARVFC